ncbi:hypothetical protein [Mycobacterium sp. UM_CSW]|nr:hypothetical protein [Mycobacterium sp. UM_CSW]
MPVGGAATTGLAIVRLGVCPLLVNGNDEPGDASRASLAATRLLLPGQ